MLVNPILDTATMLSAEAAADLLTRAMADPLGSSICASRMHVAAMRMDQGLKGSTGDRMTFASSFPQFLRAGIRFLTTKRTRTEHYMMCHQLCKCHCDYSELGHLHAPTDPDAAGTEETHISERIFLGSALNTVISFIHIALASLPRHEFRKKPKDGRVAPWPMSKEDLFPFTLEDTIV
jgi:hypothetical protein